MFEAVQWNHSKDTDYVGKGAGTALLLLQYDTFLLQCQCQLLFVAPP